MIGIFAGLFFTTLSILMLEISLTRIFSAIAWYHFAFMVVSLALFGIGASGVYIYALRRKYSKDNVVDKLKKYAVLFSIFTIIALIVILNVPFNPRIFNMENIIYLSIYYIFSSIPFFFGGLVISLILTYFGKIAGKIYFFDLLGAGIGSFLTVGALEILGINSIILVGVTGSLAAILFSFPGNKKNNTAFIVFTVIVGLLIFNYFTGIIDVTMAKGKDLSSYGILETKWNAISRVDVYANGSYASWGIPKSYSGKEPSTLGMMIDASAYTPIINQSDTNWKEYLKHDVTNAHYYIADKPSVLIIGPGGGRDVLGAIIFNSTKITGVELNPLIVDMVKNKFSYVAGDVYDRPDVNIVVDEGRSYIERNEEKYDIIQLSLVDTWAAVTSGAYTLSENYLYTEEAFDSYITDLNENGVLSITRWAEQSQMLRLIGIGMSALQNMGITDVSNHFMAIESNNIVNVMIKKSPFTEEEIEKIENSSQELDFSVIYAPYKDYPGPIKELLDSNGSQLYYSNYYADNKQDISPVTDDKPFFFYSLHLEDSPNLFNLSKTAQLTNVGILLLFVLLLLSLVLVVLFVFGPLLLSNGIDFPKNGPLTYFAAIGLGFISIEIAFMQKFILFLGHPVYSLSVILFSLLIFSGIGSYLTSKIQKEKLKQSINISVIALILLVVAYIIALPVIFSMFIANNIVIRILISILLLLPLGIVMGTLLPVAVKILSTEKRALIAWCWGVNGAASVLGSISAVIIAMNWGFSTTLLFGAVAYLIAMISGRYL